MFTRKILVLALLFWFQRFDPESGRLVIEGGVADATSCEAMAAEHGFLVRLISVRKVYSATEKDAKGQPRFLGQYQNACFEGDDSLRSSAQTVIIR